MSDDTTLCLCLVNSHLRYNYSKYYVAALQLSPLKKLKYTTQPTWGGKYTTSVITPVKNSQAILLLFSTFLAMLRMNLFSRSTCLQ